MPCMVSGYLSERKQHSSSCHLWSAVICPKGSNTQVHAIYGQRLSVRKEAILTFMPSMVSGYLSERKQHSSLCNVWSTVTLKPQQVVPSFTLEAWTIGACSLKCGLSPKVYPFPTTKRADNLIKEGFALKEPPFLGTRGPIDKRK